jgi:hypothetical protein
VKLKATKQEFEKFIAKLSMTVSSLTHADSVRVMLDFYRQIHIDDVALEDSGGDMLLYQWGTYDWGHGRFFQCDITRQFIVAGSDGDDGFRQLSLTCFFPPSPTFDALKAGNQWCRSSDGLVGFEAFILESSGYQAVATSKPHKVTIEYGGV